MNSLDERVSDGLRELVGRAPVDAEVWDDTARYVKKHQHRRQAIAGGSMTMFVAAIAIAAAVSVNNKGGTHPVVAHQPLPNGTVTLKVQGNAIEGVSADGTTLAPVYVSPQKNVSDVQLSADHNTLWYAARDTAVGGCDAPIYKVDLLTQTETEVTQGIAFSVSPDETQMAVGRRTGKDCMPESGTNVWIRNLATGTERELPLDPSKFGGNGELFPFTPMQITWSPDGTRLATVLGADNNTGFVFDVPATGALPNGKDIPFKNGLVPDSMQWTSHGLLIAAEQMSADSQPVQLSLGLYDPDAQAPPQILATSQTLAGAGGVFAADGRYFVVTGYQTFGNDAPQLRLYQVLGGSFLVQPGNTADDLVVLSGASAPSAADAAQVCANHCIGLAHADVDGDGRPDLIGYDATSINKDGTPTLARLTVVLASGRTITHDLPVQTAASWIGATDMNGDGRAEILLIDTMGAHAQSGKIYAWDGNDITPVTGADGKPFPIVVDSFAMGGSGFTCDGDKFETAYVLFNGVDPQKPGPWDVTTDTYEWHGHELAKVGSTTSQISGGTSNKQPAGVTDLEQANCSGVLNYPG
jgi:hypothetical protein